MHYILDNDKICQGQIFRLRVYQPCFAVAAQAASKTAIKMLYSRTAYASILVDFIVREYII